MGIHALLKSGGLFFMGVYGGEDHEGILQTDSVRPKRFFASYTDAALLERVMAIFELLYFRQVDVGLGQAQHFQSLILRKSL